MPSEFAVNQFAGSPPGVRGIPANWQRHPKPAALAILTLLFGVHFASAVILWSDPGAMLVFDNGAGRDLLEGAVKRDDSANDTLYFKFHVDPQSDSTTEEYFAALELFEGDTEQLGIGNAMKAWAYSAFVDRSKLLESDRSPDYVDLRSSALDQSAAGTSPSYELPRRGVERTIVFKVQFVAGGDDLITVWLNPDLSPGASEVHQPESLTTRFSVNASFDELRLRHAGGGTGWLFSGLAIATSFADFVDTSSSKPAAAAADDNFSAQRSSFQSWQREPGMPRGPIRALAQTHDGYLWLAADEVLARFDGMRFVHFDLSHLTRGNPIRKLFGDSHGAIWIGTAGSGLIRYVHGEFSTFTARDGLPTNSITALSEDKGGRLWIGTERGLRVWQEGKITSVSGIESLSNAPITALCQDSSVTTWIGVGGVGVFQFRSGSLTQIGSPEIDTLLRQPHCVVVDARGRIWIGAGDDFVLYWDGGEWRRFRIPRHSATPFVTSLAGQPDGTAWAGSTSEGLFQFRDGKLAAVNANTGLFDNRVNALFTDRDGHLWIGRDSGLSRLRRDQLFALGPNEGLGFGAVRGLAEVAPGVIWAVKPNDGLYRWEGRNFNRLTAAGLSQRDAGTGAMLVTRDGSCWIAVTNGLRLYRDPQAVADESRLLELTNASITALAEALDNTLWAGSRAGGLWRLTRGQWTQAAQLPTTNDITSLAPENDGSIWAGTDGDGLFRWENSVREHFDRGHGLLSDVIRTLYRDSDGVLWIGTADGGLARWHNGQMANFATQQGLPENAISQILEDNVGRLWLGGDRGITCVSKQDLTAPSASQLKTVFPFLHGLPEGIASDECSSGFFPSGLRMNSGLLWFATHKGIIVASPQLLPTNSATPTVMLEDVLVDGEPAGFKVAAAEATPVRIPPGKHRIEVHYTSINFDSPEQLRFRHQLVGLDADWADAGSRRVAFYNYVPPGEYRLRVAASNGGEAWNECPASLTFSISSHFWQRSWVITLGLLGLLAAVAGGVRIVEKRKAQQRLKRLEQERVLERERHRIAQDLHDEMGAKLCRISFLSEHAQRNDNTQGEVRNQINNIADASRELLHTLDEIVWAVNPHNDTLEHVASYINQYAQNYFQNTGLACELDMPDQFEPHPVSSQARHHLFLAVHEAFTNVLKHSNGTRAKVKMTCVDSNFEIRVEDNGKGFNPTVQNTNSTDGLRNMRERLEAVGGRCEINSLPDHGTKICFTLPLNLANTGKIAS
ncbi:MAG: two-component regulator propeller domain-containing protein [Verrucomicrobiota bacterium]